MLTRKPLTQRKIWKIQEADQDASEALAAELDISLPLARLLVSRGFAEPEAAEQYLHPQLSHLHSPFLLEDMKRAVERIQRATAQGETVCVYGDYDVDGMTSSSLLLGVFRHLGIACDYYIPNRMEEGYGMNQEAIQEIHSRGASLIISVDCGITSLREIERANELGMDVIITDHHEPDAAHLPPAYAILNPKLSEQYPFDGLAGVGIAFKLAHALAGGGELPDYLYQQLDLVALGTVVDVTPLVNENRILTHFGLQVLDRRERMGIRALCEVAKIDVGRPIKAYTLGFVLGPRLNAAGRLDTAQKAVELLTTDSFEVARKLAGELDAENRKRKEIELSILEQAEAKIKRDVDLTQAKGIVIAEEGWHRGVIGIVASRLVERYNRPTILIAVDGDEGHGSARSIEPFNLYEGIAACQEYLERFGGHRAAAGLSILKKNIPRLRYQFSKVTSENLTEEDLISIFKIDLLVPLDKLSEALINELAQMEPFGMGNTKPVLAVKGATLQWPATVMGQGHLQFRLSSEQGPLRAVGWNMGSYQILLQKTDTPIDVAFYLEINEYQGKRNLQLSLKDIQVQSTTKRALLQYPETADGPAVLLDQRSVYDKVHYLQELVRRGEPTIVYVRSDTALEHLAKEFRDIQAIYYGYSNSEEERQQALGRFSETQETLLVSSLTLPEFVSPAHIVFCHPVPARQMFIRRCQPAFQDDRLTSIHLIFHPKDVNAMHASLQIQCPPREVLVKFYRDLRKLASANSMPLTLDAIQKKTSLSQQTIRQGLTIFAELEFLLCEADSIRLLPPPAHRKELTESATFGKGENIRQEALEFGRFLSEKSIKDLWGVLRHVEA